MNNAREVLEKEGFLVSTTTGFSMHPMLKDRRDTVIIKKTQGRLKKYDVAFYESNNHLVLHRVIQVLDNGYLIRGDNCFVDEMIDESQIIGVLDVFYRKDKKMHVSDFLYQVYCRIWVLLYPLRKWKRNI